MADGAGAGSRPHTRQPGTPLRGEREVRQRLFSPLHTMDGDEGVEEEARPAVATPPDARPQPVTLSAIAELLDKKFDERLRPVLDTVRELQDDVARVESNVDNMFEGMEEKNAELLSKIEAVNEDLQRFKEAAKHTGVGRDGSPQDTQLQHDLTQQIAQLEVQMRTLMQTGTDETKLIAVFGGLDSLGDEWEASKWIKDRLWEGYVVPATEYYVKGDFKGLLFAKFSKQDDRDTAVATIRSLKHDMSDGKRVWAKEEQPLGLRVARQTLFGAKWMLSK